MPASVGSSSARMTPYKPCHPDNMTPVIWLLSMVAAPRKQAGEQPQQTPVVSALLVVGRDHMEEANLP